MVTMAPARGSASRGVRGSRQATSSSAVSAETAAVARESRRSTGLPAGRSPTSSSSSARLRAPYARSTRPEKVSRDRRPWIEPALRTPNARSRSDSEGRHGRGVGASPTTGLIVSVEPLPGLPLAAGRARHGRRDPRHEGRPAFTHVARGVVRDFGALAGSTRGPCGPSGTCGAQGRGHRSDPNRVVGGKTRCPVLRVNVSSRSASPAAGPIRPGRSCP